MTTAEEQFKLLIPTYLAACHLTKALRRKVEILVERKQVRRSLVPIGSSPAHAPTDYVIASDSEYVSFVISNFEDKQPLITTVESIVAKIKAAALREKDLGKTLQELHKSIGQVIADAIWSELTGEDAFWPFTNILLPMIRRILPNTIAASIAGVQPMTGPVGQIYSMRPNYKRYKINLTKYRIDLTKKLSV